ncbi:type IV secretion system protein VirB5 [Rhizobium sullae]|uniref:Type IV secretion system protein VirB5 n=1 Tax=Rhizobium sullae TaxID=50338 RepID=A0A4R3PQA8_RHISU|nr:type IV secretion system protein VirB5 [Rhizobium sullae]TCU03559.1 type IV secretion system protein VirB5 [Rhizobium sullae]UWU19099.1 type IV secretion system protein VirB5 [Rhizobium sullae]
MKFTQLTVTTLAACLIMQAPARAQFLVTDPGTIAQTTITAANTTANLAKTIEIVTQTVAMVDIFRSVFSVTEVLSQLNQGNNYPSTNNLREQMFDSKTPASATANSIVRDSDRYIDGKDKDAHAELLREQIAGAANTASIAAANLELMDKRLRENGKTLGQLSSSKNIMAATVTNGLLLKQIHDAIIQNSQATSLLTMATAQAGLHAAEEAAAQRRERKQTAALFR